MKPSHTNTIFLLSLVFALITGCSYPFHGSGLSQVDRTATFSMVQQHPKTYQDQYALWGGQIIGTTNRPNDSEISVVEMPLDSDLYPLDINLSQGRFIAKSNTFLDPEIYGKKTRVTVIGKVTGEETRPIGETQYTYPVLEIKQIHVWEGYRISSKPGLNRDPFWGWDAYLNWTLDR